MLPTLGFAFLLAVFLLNLMPPFVAFFHLAKKRYKISKIEKAFFSNSLLSLICAAAAQMCLIYSFVISDYSVLNVHKNSHHLKPLLYKISGSWGNHEGSMLLLISVLCAYSFAFNFFSKIDSERKIFVNAAQSFTICCFAFYTACASNPFVRNLTFATDGLGLNPILQDIGLALHPPMLYIGYIGFSLIFSFAIAGLLSEKVDREFALKMKPWLFFSYGFLTAGIGLGAWWAYRELGWGGYWFWDPVENVSLMPWLSATALIHCLKLVERRESFKVWTVFLAIFTFILCLLGLFLVRSGVLTSVHAFAIDATRGFFIITLISLIGGGALLLFGMKMNKLKSENFPLSFSSKIGAILFNNYFLMIAVMTVLLGTLYPIFLRSFFNEFISIGPGYYNKIFSILLLPFLLLLGVSAELNYEKNSNKRTRITLILAAATMLAFLSKFFFCEVELVQIIILVVAISAFFQTVFSEFARRNLIMMMAHTGFCIVVCGVILSSSFSQTKEVNLRKNESLKIGNYELKFIGEEYRTGKNFIARQGDFTILRNGKELGRLAPQLRYYPISEQTTNEAAIAHKISGDLYVVIGNKDEQENYAVRAYYKPMIWLVWIGCAMIFLAMMSAIARKLRIKN